MNTAKRNDPVFLAWCAGFFDGEGTVCIQKHMDRRSPVHKERYFLHVMIYQTEREPLDEIADAFGGSISKLKTRVYALHLTQRTGEAFLRAVRPHCRVKGPEVDIALDFQSTFTGRNTKRLDESVVSHRLSLRENLIEFRRAKYARAKETA